MKGTLKTCPKEHQFYKNSDCPSCPKCEAERKPKEGLLSQLSAPARSALEHEGIFGTKELSNYSEKETLALHGRGSCFSSKTAGGAQN